MGEREGGHGQAWIGQVASALKEGWLTAWLAGCYVGQGGYRLILGRGDTVLLLLRGDTG